MTADKLTPPPPPPPPLWLEVVAIAEEHENVPEPVPGSLRMSSRVSFPDKKLAVSMEVSKLAWLPSVGT